MKIYNGFITCLILVLGIVFMNPGCQTTRTFGPDGEVTSETTSLEVTQEQVVALQVLYDIVLESLDTYRENQATMDAQEYARELVDRQYQADLMANRLALLRELLEKKNGGNP